MKFFSILIATVFSINCYGQNLDSVLQKLIPQYASQKQLTNNGFKQTTLQRGSFLTSAQLTNKRTGTKDSERGELSSKGSMIYYDISHSAGTHMNLFRKKECTVYAEEVFNGYKTIIGLVTKDGKSELIITLYSNSKPGEKEFQSFPANFWSTVTNEADINTMLEIASSYTPAK